MIRAVTAAIVVLLALHFVALAGLVGWLGMTGRLNEQRAKRVVEMFDTTIAEQKKQQAEARAKAEKAREKAEKAARLEAVSDGPQTLQARLAAEQRADALAMHRVERLERDTSDLRQQMERAKELISEQKQQLKAEREKFRETVEQRNEKMRSAQFKQTVRMYEQLGADQAKRMFQELMNQGQTDRVIDYLAEMQLRKAGKILQSFETPPEIKQATRLLEKLRQRDVYPLGGAATDNTADQGGAAQQPTSNQPQEQGRT